MEAVCTKPYYDLDLANLLPESEFNTNKLDIVHTNTRSTYHIIRGLTFTPTVFTHSNCICNEFVAFYFRHMVHDPECTEDGISFSYPLNNIYNVINTHMIPHMEILEVFTPYDVIIKKYSGRFRAKYLRAKHLLCTEGIQARDFTVKCFLKDDKYHLPYDSNITNDSSVISDQVSTYKVKAPRAIQYQSAKATLFKAQFIVPLEKQFYSIEDIHGLKIFTKGLNHHEVAQLIVDGSFAVKDAVFIENDFSSFDAHVVVNWLRIFRKFVKRCVPIKYHKIVEWAMHYDDRVRGWTTRGVSYTILGTLTSGSIDTSFKGNFINYVIVLTILTVILKVPETDFKFVCNGDDSVLILAHHWLDRYLKVDFKQFSMNAKVLVKYSKYDVDFCQSQLVRTSLGFCMMRNPLRIFTRLGWMVQKRSNQYYLSYLKTVIMGEMALNYMVPVLYPLLQKMLHTLSNVKVLMSTGSSYVDEMYFENKYWAMDEVYKPNIDLETPILEKFPFLSFLDTKQFMTKVDIDYDCMNEDSLNVVLSTLPKYY